MIIRHFKLSGLYQNESLNFDLNFNEDINVLAGKNGSGKTTVLKLIWYLISGNIERVIPDMNSVEDTIFDEVEIETDTFSLNIKVYDQKTPIKRSYKKQKSIQKQTIEKKIVIVWDIGKGEKRQRMSLEEYGKKMFHQFLNREILKVSGCSIFFPTFRRIEGGFFTSPKHKVKVNSFEEALIAMPRGRIYQGLEKWITNFSKELSVHQHKFITSISTEDISYLLTRQYADISESTNKLQSELSHFITEQTSRKSSAHTKSNQTDILEGALDEIQAKVDEFTARRNELLKPFTLLSEMVNNIFQYEGIKITDTLALGELKNALASEKLSSGEKQMLSFLCYNAFCENHIVIIDEPELSLHVDWQRLLFPTLLGQKTNNQFIVATHSPFICTKYSDKELIIGEDRGGY